MNDKNGKVKPAETREKPLESANEAEKIRSKAATVNRTEETQPKAEFTNRTEQTEETKSNKNVRPNTNNMAQHDSYERYLDELYEKEQSEKNKDRFAVTNHTQNRYVSKSENTTEVAKTQKIGNARFMHESNGQHRSGNGSVNKAYAAATRSMPRPEMHINETGNVKAQADSNYAQYSATSQPVFKVRKTEYRAAGNTSMNYNDTEAETSGANKNKYNDASTSSFGVNQNEIYNRLYSQIGREKILQNISGEKGVLFKKLYPAVGSMGLQLVGGQSLRETEPYKGYREVETYAGYAFHKIAKAGANASWKDKIDKEISQRLVNQDSLYKNALSELKHSGVRTSSNGIRMDKAYGQSSKGRIMKQIQKYGLENNLGDLTKKKVHELKSMLSDTSVTNEQHDIIKLAIQIRECPDLSAAAVKSAMSKAGMNTKNLTLNLKTARGRNAVMARMSRSFTVAGQLDYTKLSVKRLESILKSGPVDDMYKDAINVIIASKKTANIEKRFNASKKKGSFSKEKIAQKVFAGADAFDGAMLMYRSITSVKTALVLANIAKRLVGKTLNFIYRKTGIQKVVQKRVQAHINKSTPRILKQKAKETKRAVKKQSKINKMDKRAARKDRFAIKKRVLSKVKTTVVYKRLANSFAGRLLMKILAPFRSVAKVLSAFTAKLAEIAVAAGAIVIVVVLITSILTTFFNGIAQLMPYSESSVLTWLNGVLNPADTVEDSELYKLVNELWAADDQWADDIEAIEGKTPKDVLKEYWKDAKKTHPSPWGGQDKILGYFDPESGGADEITIWGSYDSESVATNPDGYSTIYLNGKAVGKDYTSTDDAIARYQNIKMCVSLAHVFVGLDYGSYQTVGSDGQETKIDHLTEFTEYAKALWFYSHDIAPVISPLYQCIEGDKTYGYHCNKKGDYNFSSDPAASNYVHLVAGESIVPYNANGCVTTTHSWNQTKTETHYDANGKYSAAPITSTTTGEVKVVNGSNTTYTYANGGKLTYRVSGEIAKDCNDNIVIDCRQSNCTHSGWKNCSGCQKTTSYEYETYFCGTTVSGYDYSGYYRTYTNVVASPGCANCRVVGTLDNITYFTCLGHTRQVKVETLTCPGHRVCLGHVKCNGHHSCPDAGHSFDYCTGHVDVSVRSTIMGITLDEISDDGTTVNHTENTLFDETLFASGNEHFKYSTENGKENFYFDYAKAKEKVGFEGWTTDNIEMALYTYSADWNEMYGIEFAEIQGMPLEDSEILEILSDLDFTGCDGNEAEIRRSIINTALESVSIIPFYKNGKADYPGYDDNHFGSYVTPDSDGRTAKGLDCPHWVSWAYWTTINDNLGNGTAAELMASGSLVPTTADKLKPGDILVTIPTDGPSTLDYNGTVAIFVGYNLLSGDKVVIREGPHKDTVHINCTGEEWTNYYTYKNISGATLADKVQRPQDKLPT